MKKIAPVVAVALLALFASCKKDYTCECTVDTGGVVTTASGKTGKMSKKDAKAKCNEGDKEYDLLGTKVKSECEIK